MSPVLPSRSGRRLPQGQRTDHAIRIVMLAAAYAAGAHLGMLMASTHAPATPVWLPSGIAVAGLTVWGLRYWPAVALGSVVATVTTGGPLHVAVLLSVGAALEAWLAASVFTHPLFALRLGMDRVRDIVVLTFVSMAAPTVTATLSTAALCLLGRVPWEAYSGTWGTWWVGNALGLLLLTPMLLSWRGTVALGRRRARVAEASGLLAAVAALSWVAFSWSPPAAFLLAPLLTVTAIRFGPRGAAATLLLVSSVAIWNTFRGVGPFATVPLEPGMVMLQVFVAVGSVTFLFLAAAISERDRVRVALSQARDELEDRVAERTESLRLANERLEEELLERQRAEEERRRLEAQIRQSQKLESLGLLAGGIAHDFNNLLTAILGHADLAKHSLPEDSPLRRHIDEIDTASHRAADLAGQMLAYSGRRQLARQPVRLPRLVEEMGRLIHASVPKKVALEYRLDPDVPLIEADPTQLRQVGMNLIINASEAVGESAGTVTVSARSLDYPGDRPPGEWITDPPAEGRWVALEVADTGCGMEPGALSRAFDPFFTTKVSGRGLGLAVVLGIVRGHSGHLAVASAPGKGTVFTVLFPPAAGPEAGPASDDEHAACVWVGRGTILIVDDEPAVARLASAMVRRCGFETLVAVDGEEALQMFRAHLDRITCVLLDVSMPRMGGREALRELRRISPRIPVVLSSGYPEPDQAEDAAVFVQKPYRLATLAAALERAMTEKGSDLISSGRPAGN